METRQDIPSDTTKANATWRGRGDRTRLGWNWAAAAAAAREPRSPSLAPSFASSHARRLWARGFRGRGFELWISGDRRGKIGRFLFFFISIGFVEEGGLANLKSAKSRFSIFVEVDRFWIISFWSVLVWKKLISKVDQYFTLLYFI